MYLLENLAYALVQLAHNFGAVAVVGGAIFALWPVPQTEAVQRSLAWLVLTGWAVQITSGVLFGVVSYLAYGTLPDLSAIALSALAIKILSTIGGLTAAIVYLRGGTRWTTPRRRHTWHLLAGLGALALAAAAFLRWFS
ncbi:hypothetical protein HUS23_13530 [Ectothiorhodospiraceae bacterium 2226]|nr:hypothetical protein HUS23_13530 [Ectothiorhodospiraceae bacterium 2226]